MAEQAATGIRLRTSGRARSLVFAVVLAVAAFVLFIATGPTVVEGTATLSECHWGSPIVSIDGGDPYLPVAAWPDGLHYDREAQAVVDASGQPVIRRGGRAALKGIIVEVDGDIPLCFHTRQIRLTSITPVP